MKLTLDNGKMKIFEVKEVEVENLTVEEANNVFDVFTETLYEAVGEAEWTDVLEYIKQFSDEACKNFNV